MFVLLFIHTERIWYFPLSIEKMTVWLLWKERVQSGMDLSMRKIIKNLEKWGNERLWIWQDFPVFVFPKSRACFLWSESDFGGLTLKAPFRIELIIMELFHDVLQIPRIYVHSPSNPIQIGKFNTIFLAKLWINSEVNGKKYSEWWFPFYYSTNRIAEMGKLGKIV